MIKKRNSITLMKSYKKKTPLYSVLKYVAILLFVIGIIIVFISDNDQTNYPYYPSQFVQIIIFIISILSAFYVFIYVFNYLWKRDIPTLKKDNFYRPIRLKIYLGLFLVLNLFGSSLLASMAKQSTVWMMNGLFSAVTHVWGNEQVIMVQIQQKVFENPDHQQSITLGSVRHSYTLIDPAPYKIAAKISINDHQHWLPIHCYIGPSQPQLITYQYNLNGKVSFLGFKCIEKCTLNYRYKTHNHQPVTNQNLIECEELYRKIYQANQDK